MKYKPVGLQKTNVQKIKDQNITMKYLENQL